MKDDPSVKEVLTAVANIPKRIGQSLLDKKVPVSRVASVGNFLSRHWLAGLTTLLFSGWLSYHYMSQMTETRYMCHGPKATFSLSTNPSTYVEIRAAIALSPLTQGLASLSWETNNQPDMDFNFRQFMDDNQEYMSYFTAAAGAMNLNRATEIIRYERGQTIARCIANESWLTLLVVFAQVVFAYLLLLVLLPARGRSQNG